MPHAQPLRASLNAGELTPRLAARSDFDKYKNGFAVLENMIPMAEGAATRRPGTRYVAEVSDSTKAVRIKDFKFSTTQAYIVTFEENRFGFFRNQGIITAGTTDGSVSNGTFTTDISSSDGTWVDASTNGSLAHSSSDGSMKFTINSSSDTAFTRQTVTISSSVVTNEHIAKFQIKQVAGRALKFSVGTSSSLADLVSAVSKKVGYHAVPFTPNSTQISLQFKLDGSEITMATSSTYTDTYEAYLDDVALVSSTEMEIDTPYSEADLFDVDGPQSADVLYLFNNSYASHKLLRLGHTNWSLEQVYWVDGPYLDTNATDTTLAINSSQGVDARAATITASAVTGINDDTGFGSSDIGRHVRISNPSTGTIEWGWGVITGSTSTTAITVDVKREFPSTAATTEWKLGSWSDERGWPGVGTFHQQRLVTAQTSKEPQTFWLSQVGDFENNSPDSLASSSSKGEIFDGTVEDDDALNFAISSDDVEAIRWMSPGTTLQIGTRAAEWEVTSEAAAISPTDIRVLRHTKHGSAAIQPIRIGHTTLFVQREGRTIRELAFNFEVDGLVANDMTRLSEHITIGGLKQMAYQQEPHSLIWAVRKDGQLVSMTYRREEDVVALGRHILGGSYDSGDAVVESVATIPGSTATGQTQESDDRDEVWVCVKRTIDGSTKRYIEFFEREFEDGDNQEDSYYADSLLTYDDAASSQMTGFSHLSGETVKVYGDGAILPDATVSSSAGTFNITNASDVVQSGLGYTHRMKPLKLDAGARIGTAQGQVKRIDEIAFLLQNSQTITYGPSSSQLSTLDFREVADVSSVASPLFTGEKKVSFPGAWETDPRIVIESSDPAPFTLLGYVPSVRTQDQP